MKVATSLPDPSDDAREHSSRLLARIHEEIAAQGGSIPFRRFLELALYEPALGYYVAGKRKFGQQGDFVTAPEISSLFSFCLASQCQQILEALDSMDMGGADILEFGAGTGTMAVDILRFLEREDRLPEHYLILDVSPELKAIQRETLAAQVPHLLHKVVWLKRLPDAGFKGIVLANEVLDAMPVDLFRLSTGGIAEYHISSAKQQLFTCLKPPQEKLARSIAALQIPATDAPYTSELNPGITPWLQAIADIMTTGVVLLIDYGYVRKEYYHPDRREGTLICHYQHRVHNDFLYSPGLQDITANVDFTAVAEAGEAAGFTLAGFTHQAAFLIANGLETFLNDALNQHSEKQYALAQQVRMLTLPAEMGERFKVIALNKNLELALNGFRLLDQRHRL